MEHPPAKLILENLSNTVLQFCMTRNLLVEPCKPKGASRWSQPYIVVHQESAGISLGYLKGYNWIGDLGRSHTDICGTYNINSTPTTTIPLAKVYQGSFHSLSSFPVLITLSLEHNQSTFQQYGSTSRTNSTHVSPARASQPDRRVTFEKDPEIASP